MAIAWATALFEASSVALMFLLVYLFLLSLVALGLALSAVFTKVSRLAVRNFCGFTFRTVRSWTSLKISRIESLKVRIFYAEHCSQKEVVPDCLHVDVVANEVNLVRRLLEEVELQVTESVFSVSLSF